MEHDRLERNPQGLNNRLIGSIMITDIMNDDIRRTTDDAERHPRRPQHLLLQGSGALGWGLFFSISPVLEILVLLALVALVLIAAHLAPLKYEDSRTIGPLSGTQLTLSALAAQSNGTVVITAHPREVGEGALGKMAKWVISGPDRALVPLYAFSVLGLKGLFGPPKWHKYCTRN